MADPFQQGDDAKNKYLEQAMHANEEAASGSKFTDLYDKNSAIYKDPNADVPKPAPEPLPPKPTVDAEGYPIIEQVRTYKEDLADIVNKDKLSLSRIAMMEGTANKGLQKDTTIPVKKKPNILLIISIGLIILGIGVAGGVLMLALQKSSNANTANIEASKEKYIIFSETSEPLVIAGSTKTEIGGEIASLIDGFREEGSIMEIIPTGSTGETVTRLPLSSLLTTTGSRMPDELARTMYDRFFLGLYSQKGTSYPFLLFYIESYDIAYPALLEWEGFMPDDMNWLFPRPARDIGATPLLFNDRVIANKDARSFEDEEGKTAFFYMFLDDHTVLMARTADTVRIIENRIREAKFQ